MAAAANAEGELQHAALLPGSEPPAGRGPDVLHGRSIIHHLLVSVENESLSLKVVCNRTIVLKAML